MFNRIATDMIEDRATGKKLSELLANPSTGYIKPETGIPKTDLETAVQTTLNNVESYKKDLEILYWMGAM